MDFVGRRILDGGEDEDADEEEDESPVSSELLLSSSVDVSP